MVWQEWLQVEEELRLSLELRSEVEQTPINLGHPSCLLHSSPGLLHRVTYIGLSRVVRYECNMREV